MGSSQRLPDVSIVDGHLFAFVSFGRCFTRFVGVVIYPRFRVFYQPAATADVGVRVSVVGARLSGWV